MDTKAVDVRAVLCKAIDVSLLSAPIKVPVPVVHQFLEVRERNAVTPTGTYHFIRPARVSKTLP